MARLFIGFDSSTQSLSTLVIDIDQAQIIYEKSLNFDNTFPHYQTENGLLTSSNPTVVHAPPLMWVEALEKLLTIMKGDGIPLFEVAAISGSGQQHGSVYLNKSFRKLVRPRDIDKPLHTLLENVLSRPTSPIWMDSSTTPQCREIAEAMGGDLAVCEATGSIPFERFTGPQIRKFFQEDPEGYDETAHIMLVSSFMASMLIGDVAPIDHGDGAGMNMMDIRKKIWYLEALDAMAPDLIKKLPDLCLSSSSIGKINPYLTAKYGFNPDTKIIAWSGDNPNSMIGLGLIRDGMTAISLGTSDTYFGAMEKCRTDPAGEGSVFVSPTGDYMSLICFENGSLAREKIKDSYGLDWDGFSEALRKTTPGNYGGIMLPYFEPEIVPKVLKPGVRRFDLPKDDVARNCRAVVEAQMMSMRIHSAWMNTKPTSIYATGGASQNSEILQIVADVHDCSVFQIETTNSAALGAALRAAQGYELINNEPADWPSIVDPFTRPIATSKVESNPIVSSLYNELTEKYKRCEETL